MSVPAMLTLTADSAAVVYTRLEQPIEGEPGVVAGGLLGGDPALVAAVQHVLAGGEAEEVCVAQPNLHYRFTAARDTLADVAAAMLVASNGRGQLCDLGWDVLAQVMDDDDPDDADLIH